MSERVRCRSGVASGPSMRRCQSAQMEDEVVLRPGVWGIECHLSTRLAVRARAAGDRVPWFGFVSLMMRSRSPSRLPIYSPRWLCPGSAGAELAMESPEQMPAAAAGSGGPPVGGHDYP